MTSPATTAPTDPQVATTSAIRVQQIKNRLKLLTGPLVGLILLIIALSLLSPVFLTPNNLVNILVQVSYVGIMAAGATLVIILGGIDLSVSAVLGLSFMVVAVAYQNIGLPFELCILIGLGVGTGIGLINGVLIAFGNVQPFIATLATMFAATGLSLYLTNGTPILGLPSWFQGLSQ
ncbi:MAG TPA: ABC transporter permease, partial [Naasia sp.]